MGKFIIGFLMIMSCYSTLVYGQEKEVNVNLIIVINDKVAIESISNLRLIINTNLQKKELGLNYIPGKLTIKGYNSIDQLRSEEIESIILSFVNNKYCEEGHQLKNYEIELKEEWLAHSFLVLRFYNLSEGIYKKQFNPIKGKDYTFEVDLPGYSIERVKRKRKKNDCK